MQNGRCASPATPSDSHIPLGCAPLDNLYRTLLQAEVQFRELRAWPSDEYRLTQIRSILPHTLVFHTEDLHCRVDRTAHIASHADLLSLLTYASSEGIRASPREIAKRLREWVDSHLERYDKVMLAQASPKAREGTRGGGNVGHIIQAVHPVYHLMPSESILLHARAHLLHEGQFIPCFLLITSCRLSFLLQPPHLRRRYMLFDVPLLMLRGSAVFQEKGGHTTILELICHNAWVVNIRFVDERSLFATARVVNKLLPQNFPFSRFFHKQFQAAVGHLIGNTGSSTILRREYQRIISACSDPSRWRISSANKGFEMTSTMPELVILPSQLTDNDLRRLASFRIKRRFPSVTWVHPSLGTCLVRASQPTVGIVNRRCQLDELYMQLVAPVLSARPRRRSLPSTEPPGSLPVSPANRRDSIGESFIHSIPDRPATAAKDRPHGGKTAVVDARPFKNAVANMAKGGGYVNVSNYPGCRHVNADVGNIHAMTKSLNQLRSLLSGKAASDEDTWLQQLQSTQWLQHIQRILQVAVRIVQMLDKEDTSVLVHCTNGWDRTSQIVSLALLLCDPYYRSIEGFTVLLEKDWCSTGHKFAERTGTLGCEEHRPQGVSPIYIQFIDCVWQLTVQFPYAFQFTEHFLTFAANSPWNGRVGSFLFNTPKERAAVETQTVSLYDYVKWLRNHPSGCAEYSELVRPAAELASAAAGVALMGAVLGFPSRNAPSEPLRPHPSGGVPIDCSHDPLSFVNPLYQPTPRVLYPSTHPRDIRLWTYYHCHLDSILHPGQHPPPSSCDPPATASSSVPSTRASSRRYHTRPWTPSPDMHSPKEATVRRRNSASEGSSLSVAQMSCAASGSGMSYCETDDGNPLSDMSEDDEAVSPSGSYRVRWFPDHLALACCGCRAPFTFFFRRHHCRLCGHVFCGDCTSQRVALPPVYPTPVRVCTMCHKKVATGTPPSSPKK